MEKRTDQDLLRAHLKGDNNAFNVLIERYTDDVFGFVLRFVNNTAAADDLVQDTFLQIHLSAQTFDLKRAFKPWMYTIAANKARDFLRSRSRRPTQSLDNRGRDNDGISAADTLESDDISAVDRVHQEEERERVRQLVAQMPENLKTVLLLGYFQKLPYAEIAEILDIPVGTVKSRLHSAVNYFASLWQEKTESVED